jgi:hypothetical protein
LHCCTGAVKRKDAARVSLDGGVEELTQAGENEEVNRWQARPLDAEKRAT